MATLQRAQTNGRFDLGGEHHLISANVYKYTDANRTTQNGTMQVASLSFTAYGSVAAQVYSNVRIDGVSCKQASLTSKRFYLIDTISRKQIACYMVVELVQHGPHGQGGFKIFRESDHALIVQSALHGEYAQVPFAAGFVSILMPTPASESV